MKTIAVIPARYGSTRLPAKPLLLINNKPMIQWVYENVKSCPLIEKIIVATDDERIFHAVKNFGGEVVLTSKKHRSGSDRVAEVVKNLSCDFVLNVQGDEPMVSRKILTKVILEFCKNKNLDVVTPVCRIYDFKDLVSPNFAKVVFTKDRFALYFTRSVVPFVRDKFSIEKNYLKISNGEQIVKKYKFYRHIGVYGFRKDFLLKYIKLPKSKLENLEKLEQLRILEHGYKIKVVVVQESPISVDTYEDLQMVRKILKEKQK